MTSEESQKPNLYGPEVLEGVGAMVADLMGELEAGSDASPATDGADTGLAQMLGSLAVAPVDWRELEAAPDQTAAARTWRDLGAWVVWLTGRYALKRVLVPPCWYLHGALVEELTALWGAWLTMYDRTQPASSMIVWHREYEWARVRLREWVGEAGCGTEQNHTPDEQQRTWIGQPADDGRRPGRSPEEWWPVFDAWVTAATGIAADGQAA
ncbi:MAG: hypothetical protein QM621_08055 [Aeromicrobium sp.]|uniref:hypothetical protein n=1 Tax=Aeromicrobium sp. TaxID=1871063 RepID=UPI0039E31DA2